MPVEQRDELLNRGLSRSPTLPGLLESQERFGLLFVTKDRQRLLLAILLRAQGKHVHPAVVAFCDQPERPSRCPAPCHSPPLSRVLECSFFGDLSTSFETEAGTQIPEVLLQQLRGVAFRLA